MSNGLPCTFRLLIIAVQEPTWLQQFLSSIINTNSAADPKSRSLVVPLTVTTRWTSISLKWTASGLAKASYLPVRLLTLRHTLEVRDTMICLAARIQYDGIKHIIAAK